MLFFFIDAFPGQIEQANPSHIAAIHQPANAYWLSLDSPLLKLDDLTVVFQRSPLPGPQPLQPPPAPEPPAISIEMLEEGIDEAGKWFQKLRVTLKPGGTLAEISEAVYGDAAHIDELLELAKQQNPHVQRPQQLRIGDAIEIKVDPSTVYVAKDTQWDDFEGKLTQTFFNGGKEIAYPDSKVGTLRIIDVPEDSRTKVFILKVDDDFVQLAPGSRFALYAYRPGDAFEDVVRRIYGSVTARALQDFIVQTKWTPDRWPPPSTEQRRLIFSTTTSWEDVRPVSTGFPEERIVTNDKYRALMTRRSEAGINPVTREGTGTVYRITITDPAIRAKDASVLLYGSDSAYLTLIARAGITLVPDASGKLPENANPPLLGRQFEIFVDYAEEWFLVENPAYDQSAHRTVTRLTNGTIFEEYDQALRHEQGLQRAMYYPTGYKKIVYRPSDIALASLDFLYFIANGLKSDPNSDADKQRSQDFIGGFLWNWAPGIPRERGDRAEDFAIFDTDDGKNIEIAIGPRASSDLVPLLLYDVWLANPCLGALVMVFFATMVVLTAGFILKRRR